MSTAKAMFTVLTGIDVGPVRLPLRQLDQQEIGKMKMDFEAQSLLEVARPRGE